MRVRFCVPFLPRWQPPLRRPLKVHVKSRQTAAHWFSPPVAAGCLLTLTLTKTGELERRLPSSLNSNIKAFIKGTVKHACVSWNFYSQHTASSDGRIIYIICCSYPFHPFSVLSLFSPFPPPLLLGAIWGQASRSAAAILYFSVCCIKNTLLGLWWPQEAHPYYHPHFDKKKKGQL